ncbi:MAG: hypothetical protein ACTHN5_05950 [Phycisphaerae bacterium]
MKRDFKNCEKGLNAIASEWIWGRVVLLQLISDDVFVKRIQEPCSQAAEFEVGHFFIGGTS